MWRDRALAAPLAAFAVALALPAAAGAAQFTVNSTADAADATPGNGVCLTGAGQCTLRAAVMEANALSGADTVVVPAGTYNTASVVTVASAMTIVGPAGSRATVIDGAPGANVFTITQGLVTLRGVTVTGGLRGIGVSAPDVALDQVAIRGNSPTSAAQVRGGGIQVSGGGNVSLTRSLVAGNIITSTVQQAIGGGIVVESGGVFTAVASTISGNAANGSTSGGFGGGVMVGAGGQATLRHVTLAGNSVSSGNSGANYGGNIYVAPADSPTPAGQLVVADSVVAAGQASSAAVANCNGSITAQGRNIDSGTTCAFGAGHLSNTDPQLLPLADHGGPTDSLAIAPTSPARDAALACPAGGLDQRGAAAPSGVACDIGAVELSADLGVTVQAAQAEAAPGADVTYVVRVANGGLDSAPGTVLDVTTGGATATLASASTGTCTLQVRCELGTLARGQEATVTVVARAGTAPIAFTAVTSSGLPDPAAANNSAQVTTPVTTTAPPSTTPPPPPTAAPALSRLRLVGRARTKRVVRIATTLSAPATVATTVDRLLPGRRVRGRCRIGAPAGTRCTLVRRVGVVRQRAAAGAVTLRIPARIRGRVLAPGRYRVRAVATDAAGRRSAPRLLTLRVTR